MFAKNKENQSRTEEIRLSPELLRIKSSYTGGVGLLKAVLILIVALLLVFYRNIINIIKDKAPAEQVVLVTMVVLFLAVLLLAIYRMNLISGKMLIITEKGFFIEPLLAEFWKNIDEYRWNGFPDVNKKLISGKQEGTSLLLLNNKGAWPRTFDLMHYGIYFTPDQMQQLDNICQRVGIKKTESMNLY